jgi:S-formylglutathione hydrolase FrmB
MKCGSITGTLRIVQLVSLILFVGNITVYGFNGTTQSHLSFIGPVTNYKVVYSIYLPLEYYRSTTKYPVIYFYGPKGSTGEPNNTFITTYELARSNGKIGDAVIVFTNCDGESFYHDSKNGTRPIATSIAVDLVNYINKTYRVKTNRGNRAAVGFSLGGGGSISQWSKYDSIFCIAVDLDGAMDTWVQLADSDDADMRKAMYEEDEAYFLTQSFWGNMPKNAAYLKANSFLLMVMGDHSPENLLFIDSLKKYSIGYEYYETGCSHDLDCILNHQYGKYVFEFIQTHFKE